jgi:hypothetical protein
MSAYSALDLQNRVAFSAGKAYYFHNFLLMNPASAQTLDTSSVALAVPDRAPATINTSGLIGIQSTGAKV